MTTGTQLRAIREKHNVTRAALAEAIGVTHNTIYNWEKGICSPPVDAVNKMAGFYDIPLEALIGRDVDAEMMHTMEMLSKLSHHHKRLITAMIRSAYAREVQKDEAE